MQSYKYYCGIYSSANPLTNNFNSDIKSKYTIWVAHYGVSKPSYSGDYGIWQTGYGKVNGVNGDCDLDIGYKDYEPIMKNSGYNGYSVDTTTIDDEIESGGDEAGGFYFTYVVQVGDSLSTIAKKLGVTINHL